jgi:hypothetical protein
MERFYGGSTKHPHAINACDFTTNFRLALLSAPLGRNAPLRGRDASWLGGRVPQYSRGQPIV